MAKQNRQKGKYPRKINSDANKTGTVDSKKPVIKAARRGWVLPLTFAVSFVMVAGGVTWYKIKHDSASKNTDSSGENVTKVSNNTGPEAGYAGSDSCAQCHQGIADSFDHIAMGRSLYPPTVDNIIEDYDKNNEFFHKASNQYFKMTQENGEFYQTRFQKAPNGSLINDMKVRVDYVVGSGNHSRSYIHREPDGKAYQLPVAWYPQEKKWAMNPGYDSARHINFSRRITYDCLFCHAAIPDLPAGADEFNYGETAFFPDKLEAIDCERCHGPAQQHVTLAKNGAAEDAIQKAIVNPGNLDNKLQMEVCMQCHLETTSGKLPHSVHVVNKGIFGYRPGEPLEEYRYAFDHPKGTGHDDKFEIAGQAYRLRMSPCFIKSEGRMTCTTCHDPHRLPKDKISVAIQSCLECHKPADCTEKMELRLPIKDNCIQCHMPQRRTDDVVNVTMTDHFIQRRPPPPEKLLAPKEEHAEDYHGDVIPYYPKNIAPEYRDLYMGLAYISNSADLEKGLKYLDSYLGKNPATFAPVYTRGVALKVMGQLDQARISLEDAVKLRPNQPQAWMALGDLFETMRNYTRSLECYQTAIKLAPKLSRPYNGAGTSQLLAGNLEGAEKYFKDAVVRDPFDENPHLNLSEIYLRKGAIPAAEAEARLALAINPSKADGWFQLAECAMSNKKYTEVIWTSLESLKLNSRNNSAFEVLSSACHATDKPAAIQWLAQEASRDPYSAGILQALLHLEEDDLTAADSALSQASLATTTPAAMATGVRVALIANRRDLALTWGQQAYKLMPDNDEVLIRYASALRAAGQTDKARSILDDSLIRMRTPRILNSLAWLYATDADPNIRNASMAQQLANEAAKALGTPNIYVMQSQAAAAAAAGNFEMAVEIAKEALAKAKDANLNLDAGRIQLQIADYETGKPHIAEW